MLRPTKHSHPDKTVLSTSCQLLAVLRTKRVAEFTRLRDLARKANHGSDVLLMPALNLLFLLGLIEYRAKNDTFEYVGQQ